MGMCVQNFIKFFILFAFIAVLGGCGALDAILPSSGTYKVNARVNGSPLDEYSFVSLNDKIQPFFEESVSGDPDIAALTVFLKDARGVNAGYTVTYSLELNGEYAPGQDEQENAPAADSSNQDNAALTEDDKNAGNEESENNNKPNLSVVISNDPLSDIEQYKKGNEYLIPVQSLDRALHYFPLPPDLPIGRYTLVSQVMGKAGSSGEKAILHKTEKSFYYLADAGFSFDSIQVNLPGVTSSSQIIPRGSVIMLEAKLDYDSRLDPYVVWYNGKK
uniref:Uncharacterized protein n=1 Tax=uncultured bacterium contig00059 TaxID=1181542 RepID=A0A0A6ZH42_9BACT|nr:hypothetical protein [uncultured bacterium contig00059]